MENKPAQTPQNNGSSGKKKSSTKDAIYIIVILLALGACGYLGYEMGQVKKQLEDCGNVTDQLQSDKDELNEILKNTGIIAEADNQELKQNLMSMLQEYDNLESSNVEMNDSIAAQKAKIQQLLTEVEDLQNQKKKDWGKIYKLKKETETLREIMKGYIHTIDSLNTLNINLQNTIVEKDQHIEKINKDLTNVKGQNDQLEQTVAAGSILQTVNISALAIKVKNSGAQKETSRANKADQFKACFTVMENKIAKSGTKTLYMRIVTPDAKELAGVNPVYFNMGGKEGTACIARQINYQNQNTDVCIYYELEEEAMEGTYSVEIYCEGHQIGKTSFALK
ncbi:hypothetical protein [Parvicella tangerina]|uniref:Chromosome partitioning protein ParA n=1 Tax=Parvicella tangerina TaxID=2829795 RepID=A0A916JPK5_9FLAO|nr:hypothetical protein [Parvicella tangerina]CAG5085765.1 hypothetical protein CRYO30217_02875 [Parvicella tangerina]